jgi:hypothetical protein
MSRACADPRPRGQDKRGQPRPDRWLKPVRFVVGALFGGLAASYAFFPTQGVVAWLPGILSVMAALLSGVLAARFGDRYWEWLSRRPWFMD